MANHYDNERQHQYTKAGQPDCLACEAMLTDALDQTLSAAEQTAFEDHIRSCTVCADQYGEAQRGVAWLELLKTPRPQPRPELLASILAQTSQVSLPGILPMIPVLPVPAVAPAGKTSGSPVSGRLLAFQPPPSSSRRASHLMLDPRLAMTAAMAFFSITLTMSLAGVRLNEMHASDLKPANLRRSIHTAQAGAIRYYDNLSVVHVLESQAVDLREGLQQIRQEPVPAPAAPDPGRTKPHGSDRQQPQSRGGSFTSPQASEPRSLFTSAVAFAGLRILIGDRA